MKSIFCLLACLGMLSSAHAFADSEPETPTDDNSISLALLPAGRPFRLTFADPREIKMALSVTADGRLFASVGNYFSLLGIAPKSKLWKLQMGVEGDGFFEMRQADSRFPLETADGLIGAYLEGSTGPFQYQFRYTHVSAHMADGSTVAPIIYSRETLTTRAAYVPSFDLQLYVGTSLLANSDPVVPPWSFQTGGAWFLEFLKLGFVPFTAWDFQYRTETQFNPSMNFEIGIALNNPSEAYRSFRIFCAYYSGEDPRGQYINQYLRSYSIGLEMQI